MTKRQLTRLCQKHGLSCWQHKAAQMLYSVNGAAAARKYVEVLVAEKKQGEKT